MPTSNLTLSIENGWLINKLAFNKISAWKTKTYSPSFKGLEVLTLFLQTVFLQAFRFPTDQLHNCHPIGIGSFMPYQVSLSSKLRCLSFTVPHTCSGWMNWVILCESASSCHPLTKFCCLIQGETNYLMNFFQCCISFETVSENDIISFTEIKQDRQVDRGPTRPWKWQPQVTSSAWSIILWDFQLPVPKILTEIYYMG